MALRNVVLPVDASECSQKAFDFYLTNIHRENDKVFLTFAMEPPHIPLTQPLQGNEEWAAKIEKAVKDANQLLEKYSQILHKKNIPVKECLDTGKPGEYICEVAKKENATLVVMGSRGLNAIRRTFLGSVSDYVVHHVHCPVVIVKPEVAS